MTILTASTSDAEALRALIDRQMLDYRVSVPCIVTAVSADGTTVDVQPAIAMTKRSVTGDISSIPMPVIAGVPIAVMRSTTLGLSVCIPITPGDDGWLIVSDRALDGWQYGSGVSPAPSQAAPRHHDLTDAVYFPGAQRKSSAIPNYPTDAVEVRNTAGTCKLSIKETEISMEVPGGGAMTLAGSTLTLTGSIVVSGDVTASGISLTTHTHGGVETGGGSTAGPNP